NLPPVRVAAPVSPGRQDAVAVTGLPGLSYDASRSTVIPSSPSRSTSVLSNRETAYARGVGCAAAGAQSDASGLCERLQDCPCQPTEINPSRPPSLPLVGPALLKVDVSSATDRIGPNVPTLILRRISPRAVNARAYGVPVSALTPNTDPPITRSPHAAIVEPTRPAAKTRTSTPSTARPADAVRTDGRLTCSPDGRPKGE